MSEYYIGVMSGTSLDGVDVALCSMSESDFKLVCAKTYPFYAKLKKQILSAIDGVLSLKSVGELDEALGEMFARYIKDFIDEFNIDSVVAIGLHGQTLWHEPKHFSMQLGSPWRVNVLTNIKVVADFRSKDIALGGQGAPLAPAFHNYIFGKCDKKTAVLNIGGMANITILAKKLIGYDIGCGNVLMDMWIARCKNLPFDKNGDFARSGMICYELLEELLDEPFFKKEYPKSTGRELFSAEWLDRKIKNFTHLRDEDIAATLLELSAKTINDELKKHNIERVIVCGGGANNAFLLERLDAKEVITSDEAGVSSEYMEAMAFAYLAALKIHNKTVDICSVSGARENSTLGVIYD